jgi:hypothetical protein
VYADGKIRWRCTNKACPAKIITFRDLSEDSSSDEHNHTDDVHATDRQRVRSACKRKGSENSYERPFNILTTQLQSDPSSAKSITSKDKKLIRDSIYRERRKNRPPIPKSMIEVHRAVEEMCCKTERKEDSLLVRDQTINTSIIIFSCQTNVETLCASERVYQDGTFTYCAAHFTQLFTLHALVNNHYIPCVFCLLPDKQSETYSAAFNFLKAKCETYNLNLDTNFCS